MGLLGGLGLCVVGQAFGEVGGWALVNGEILPLPACLLGVDREDSEGA